MPDNAFTRHLSTPIPQSDQADPSQVPNSAGGYTFTVTDQARLERFLILGTDGGTYYANEKDLTKQNVAFLIDLIKRDDFLVWDVVKDVSTNGRAYQNSPAIFALVMMFRHGTTKDMPRKTFEKTAKTLFPHVVRTSTHLFEFCKYVKLTGGWNRSLRTAVSHWYETKSAEKIAYQAVKYRQRDGWTHRDVFRLGHPMGINQRIGNFVLDKPIDGNGDIIDGFLTVQAALNVTDVIRTLDTYPMLPWEALPTQFLKNPEVWKKLFYNGQLKGQALVRNITRLARIGAFNDMMFARDYANKLTDEAMIRNTRLHPINYLNAAVVHTEGQIERTNSTMPSDVNYRKKDWQLSLVIIDALIEGFHLAFKYVIPANKRTFIGVDVSSSMSYSACFGIDLSAAQVSGAMAMTIARTEPMHMIYGFSSNHGYSRYDTVLTDLGITAHMGLSEAMKAVQKSNFGRTDCALPMLFATKNSIEVDTFVIITDNETWIGNVHPHVALREYRQKTGIEARLAVLGVSATDFIIADPTDRGNMDFVGFDANSPKVLADFSSGRI